METHGLLLCLQEANTGHFTETDESNPYPKIVFQRSRIILLSAPMYCKIPTKFFCTNLIYPMRAPFLAHLFLFDSITPTIFTEETQFIQLQFLNGRWKYS
jgi:hypothetical protein